MSETQTAAKPRKPTLTREAMYAADPQPARDGEIDGGVGA